MVTQRETLTPAEVAAALGLSINPTLARLAAGEIPAIRLGRRWFIPRAAFEVWLANAGQPERQRVTQ